MYSFTFHVCLVYAYVSGPVFSVICCVGLGFGREVILDKTR